MRTTSTSTARSIHLAARVAMALFVSLLATMAAPTGVAATAPPAAAVPTGLQLDHEAHQVECEGSELSGNGQLTGPEAYSASHLTGTPSAISLDVLIVMDLAEGPEVARLRDGTEDGEARYQAAGEALFDEVTGLLAPAKRSYPPLGITLNWTGWDLLKPLEADGTARVRTTESQEIIDLTKAQYGGVRPDDVDIVYTVTDLDMTAIGTNAVAGQADCIGGVANPENAFATGEIRHELIPPQGLPIGPITFYKNFFAKIAAHELGHLLGAHHHYQECGAPAVGEALEGGIGPCSLMTNFVDFQGIDFSRLSGLVVRAHAVDFAD